MAYIFGAGLPSGGGTSEQPILIEPIEVSARAPLSAPLIRLAAIIVAAMIVRALMRAR